MIEVRLGSLGRARLWDGPEVPAFAGTRVATRVLSAGAAVSRPSRSLAVEVVIPRGAVVVYGMLGAAFASDGMSALEMTVMAGAGAEFSDSLAIAPETALLGVPEQYAEGIVSGFLRGAEKVGRLPGGSLVFDRGAHGQVGSNPNVFTSLAACVTRLLMGDEEPWEIPLAQEFGLSAWNSAG
jgi:hypothetical protein